MIKNDNNNTTHNQHICIHSKCKVDPEGISQVLVQRQPSLESMAFKKNAIFFSRCFYCRNVPDISTLLFNHNTMIRHKCIHGYMTFYENVTFD